MSPPFLENLLVQVLKLVVADPKLRRQFIRDPASVFKLVGLGCPANFVGKQGNFCPVMPKLPDDDHAASDISHPYWDDWLKGGVDQLSDFRRVLGEDNRYPDRSSFQSQEEWDSFLQSIVDSISMTMERIHKEDRES